MKLFRKVDNMRKFIIEDRVFEIFPQLQIAVMTFKNIDNSSSGKEEILEKSTLELFERLKNKNETHPFIDDYKEAMKKIKKKKGSLASIDSMSKRIEKGEKIGSINPVVDLYNSISLKYLITCGGEDLDAIQGDMMLGFATGDENFVPLGSHENSPPREDELIYKDDLGAVVRSWLWREADRTKITHQSKNVLLYMELIKETRKEEFKKAVKELNQLILSELGGQVKTEILNKNSPYCEI